MMRSRTSMLLLVCLLAQAGVASADVTAADRATARTLAQEGQEALDGKKYPAAAERFARADSLVHAPTLLLGLARAQVGQGKLVEALESYNRIVREGVAPSAPKSWSKAYESATAEMEALTPRIPWVTITVTGPTAPEVLIDTSPVPAASLGVKRPVNPGAHTIRVSAEGYVPAEKSLTLAEGQSVQLPFELQQSAAPAANASNANAAANASSYEASPTTGRSNNTTLALIAMGVGGVALTTGVVTGFMAMGKKSKLEDTCPAPDRCPATEAGRISNYHTLAAVSTVGFIVGGLGAAAGAVLLLTNRESSSAGYVSPYVGVGSAGVTGAF